MSKEKQIEEMDADITTWFRENFYEVGRLSNYLYNNGYRKQSEPISCGHEKGGEWVQLPCKVGDILYVISQMKDKRILPFINEYYDLDNLKEMIESKANTLIEGKEAFLYVAKWLDLLQPADVVPKSEGEWIVKGECWKTLQCSACGYTTDTIYDNSPFCPNCGSRMRKEDEGK